MSRQSLRELRKLDERALIARYFFFQGLLLELESEIKSRGIILPKMLRRELAEKRQRKMVKRRARGINDFEELDCGTV